MTTPPDHEYGRPGSPGRLVIRGTTALTMDDDLGDPAGVDIVVEGGCITGIGEGLARPDDRVVDGEGTITMPGLVDTHVHLWQSALRGMASDLWVGEFFGRILPMRTRMGVDDLRDSTWVGAVELLDRGVTTALDFCNCLPTPEHADAALDGLRAAGIRGAYGYCLRDDPPDHFDGLPGRLADARRVLAGLADDPLLTGVLAMNDLEFVTIEQTAAEVALARELGVRMTLHSNHEGQITALDEAGLLGPDLLPVHCNAVSDAEFARLAATGTPISSTPTLEVGMGRDVSAMTRAIDAGVTVTLGNDNATFSRPDLLAQARLAWLVGRSTDAAMDRRDGRVPVTRREGVPRASARDVLRMVTVDAARSLGLDHLVGSLTVGRRADLLVLSTGGYGRALTDGVAGHVVLHAGIDNIRLVMVEGRIHRDDRSRVGVTDDQLAARTEEVRHRVGVSPDW